MRWGHRWGRIPQPVTVLVPAALGLLLAATTPSRAAPSYAIERESVILLDVEVVDVTPDRATTLATRSIEIRKPESSEIEVDLPWPDPKRPTRLSLKAIGTPDASGEAHRIELQSAIRFPTGPPVRSGRDLVMRDGGTALFDACERDGRRLLLVLRADSDQRPVVRQGEPVRAPVLFRLAVERVDGERFVPLETNLLQTFLGQEVEYGFRRGEGDAAESVRLVLRPVEIHGSMAEVEVEVTGSIPGDASRLAVGRTDRLFTTRGATSKLVVVSKERGAGYRFLITPDF